MGMQCENAYRGRSHSIALISFAFTFEVDVCFKMKYLLKIQIIFCEIIEKAQAQ